MLKITYLITFYNEVKTVKRAIQGTIDIEYPNKLLITLLPMEAN